MACSFWGGGQGSERVKANEVGIQENSGLELLKGQRCLRGQIPCRPISRPLQTRESDSHSSPLPSWSLRLKDPQTHSQQQYRTYPPHESIRTYTYLSDVFSPRVGRIPKEPETHITARMSSPKMSSLLVTTKPCTPHPEYLNKAMRKPPAHAQRHGDDSLLEMTAKKPLDSRPARVRKTEPPFVGRYATSEPPWPPLPFPLPFLRDWVSIFDFNSLFDRRPDDRRGTPTVLNRVLRALITHEAIVIIVYACSLSIVEST